MQNHQQQNHVAIDTHPFHHRETIQYHCNVPANRCPLSRAKAESSDIATPLEPWIDPILPRYLAHSQCRGTTTHLLSPRIVPTSLLRRRRLLSPSAIVDSLRQIPSHPREHNALSLAVGIGSMLLLLTSYLPAPFLRDLSKEREDTSRPAKSWVSDGWLGIRLKGEGGDKPDIQQ
jgi:hypothetical protein